ncbi:hypothetical protein C8T65DRAFT_829969 [Cerioporus squamosus]|nr:hypothetical protein C8T65DRAFT_829969 [Cerioporus squamosus]
MSARRCALALVCLSRLPSLAGALGPPAPFASVCRSSLLAPGPRLKTSQRASPRESLKPKHRWALSDYASSAGRSIDPTQPVEETDGAAQVRRLRPSFFSAPALRLLGHVPSLSAPSLLDVSLSRLNTARMGLSAAACVINLPFKPTAVYASTPDASAPSPAPFINLPPLLSIPLPILCLLPRLRHAWIPHASGEMHPPSTDARQPGASRAGRLVGGSECVVSRLELSWLAIRASTVGGGAHLRLECTLGMPPP